VTHYKVRAGGDGEVYCQTSGRGSWVVLQSAIDKSKPWERTVATFPEMANRCTEKELQTLRSSNDHARSQAKEPTCRKRGQPLPDSPWTSREETKKAGLIRSSSRG